MKELSEMSIEELEEICYPDLDEIIAEIKKRKEMMKNEL